MRAGRDAGQLRADLEPDHVFLALGGFALVPDRQPAAREFGGHLFDLLPAGLAPH